LLIIPTYSITQRHPNGQREREIAQLPGIHIEP
jgi:hypothetical protein